MVTGRRKKRLDETSGKRVQFPELLAVNWTPERLYPAIDGPDC